jgi:hypothetical protein
VPKQLGMIPGMAIAARVTKDGILTIATVATSTNRNDTIAAYQLRNHHHPIDPKEGENMMLLTPVNQFNELQFKSFHFIRDDIAYAVPSSLSSKTLRTIPTLYVINTTSSNPNSHFHVMDQINTTRSIYRDLTSSTLYPWIENDLLFLKLDITKQRRIRLTLYDLSNPVQPNVLHRYTTPNSIHNHNVTLPENAVWSSNAVPFPEWRRNAFRSHHHVTMIHSKYLIIPLDVGEDYFDDMYFQWVYRIYD